MSLRSLLSSGQYDLGAELLREKHRWFEKLSWRYEDDLPERLDQAVNGLYALTNLSNHPAVGRKEASAADDYSVPLKLLASMAGHVSAMAAEVLSRWEEHSAESADGEEKDSSADEAGDPWEKALRITPAICLEQLAQLLEDNAGVLHCLETSGKITREVFEQGARGVRRGIDRAVFWRPMPMIFPVHDSLKPLPPALLKAIASIQDEPIYSPLLLATNAFLSIQGAISAVLKTDPASDLAISEALAALASIRMESRSLWRFLIRDAGRSMVETFEEILDGIEAESMEKAHASVSKMSSLLRRHKSLLSSLGFQLRLETRRAFELELPSLRDLSDRTVFSSSIPHALEGLLAFYQEALALLTEEIPVRDGVRASLFSDPGAKKLRDERMRRDAWMFTQVTKGFIAKAKGVAEIADQWSAPASMAFAREFTAYYRSIACTLLARFPYEHGTELNEMLARLREGDAIYEDRAVKVIDQCEDLLGFLERTREQIDKVQLEGIPFDRKAAAKVLKFYLGY